MKVLTEYNMNRKKPIKCTSLGTENTKKNKNGPQKLPEGKNR